MGDSTTLSIILTLIDNASAALTGTAENLRNIGSQMQSIGTGLTAAVTLPIVGIGTASFKAANDFQASMEQLVTQAGLPKSQLQNLTDQILAFAAAGSQQGPEVLAQGMYHIISLGVPASDAMGVLKDASEGAAMSGANLEDVASALGAAVASNIKGSGNYNTAMAILNATVGAGNMRMQDLAQSLGNVLPQATTAGLSLTDVGAAMATMTDNGMPAADAATRLHMAISLMEAPTTKATKALSSIGITQLQLADDMRNKGLLPALQDLHDHLVNTGLTADQQAQVLSDAFGGGRSAGAIELLLNNLDRVQQKYQLIDDGVSKFTQDYQQQSQTGAASFAEGMSKMQEAAIKLGDALQGPVGNALSVIANVVLAVADGFSKLPRPVQDGILAVAALAAVVGPFLIVLGTFLTILGPIAVALGVGALALTGWIAVIALAVAAVVALGVAIYENWGSIEKWVVNLWTSITADIKNAVNGIIDIINGMINAIDAIHITIPAVNIGGVKIGGQTIGFNIPTIPHLAAGGIITSPTLALIGESGPEAVIPLSSASGASQGQGSGNIIININGGTFTDPNTTRRIMNQAAQQLNRSLKLRTV